MAVLEGLQPEIQTVATSVGRSVVGIGDRWAHGSGVVIADGKVLTNAHNLRGETVAVTFHDGRQAEGSALGVDADGDLAVVSVDTGDVPAVEWSGTNGLGIGAPVFALANPGGRGLRVTFGIVSGEQRRFTGPRGRRIEGALEHTAPLLPGSSGGPVVDAEGKVVGVNTHRLGEGFYLAIPTDADVQRRITDLGEGQSPARPRLGVAIVPPRMARRLRRAVGLPEAEGLLVRYVEEGSAAQGAGIEQGDLITKAADKDVKSPDDLFAAIEQASGGNLSLGILRGTEERTVSVTLDGSGDGGNGGKPAEA
ncbi:MAG: S1C family serine protease [Actinomycetota bacterium]